jgi:hypothetical protein
MTNDSDLKSKPETMSQAITWGVVKTRYLNEGLCEKDAAQAAWGHQNGFTQINDPCSDCLGTVLSIELIERHGIRGQNWLNSKYIKPEEH